jgi:hypothetical protein
MYTEELRILGKMNAPVPNVIAWYGGNGGVTYAGGVDCSEWQKKQYRSDTCGPHPVGRKQANQFGLYDMLGNVWEWVQDRYGEYPAGLVTDPPGPASGSSWRVNRGGSWYSYAGDSRSAARRLLRRPRPLSRLSPAEDGSVTLCTVTLLPSAGFLAWRPEGRGVQGRRPWSRRFFHRTGCCWPECSRCVLIPYWARLMMAPGGTSSKTKRCSRSATTFLSNIQ